MNFWLLMILSIELVLNLLSNKDILRPSVLFNSGFVFAAIILAINTKNWEYNISCKTLLIVCTAQVFMYLGELLGRKIKLSHHRIVIENHKIKATKKNRERENLYFSVGIVLSIALILVRLIGINRSFSSYGQGDFLFSNYRAYGIEDNSSNFGLKMLEIFNYSFTYFFFNKYCYEKGKYGKSKAKYLLFLFFCLLSCVLSSARSMMMHVVFSCTMIWLLTNRQVHGNIRISVNAKKRIIYILIIGLLTFSILGYLTGKTQTIGFKDSIYVYSSGGFLALDTFVKNFDGNSNFGFYTLSGLTRVLELIGINVSYNVPYFSHGTFLSIGKVTTNIYTCFRNYLFDYGYFGTQFIMLIFGFIFGMFYRATIYKDKLEARQYTVYSMLIFYLFFSFITERVFSQILTATMIIQVSFMLFLYSRIPFEVENSKKLNI